MAFYFTGITAIFLVQPTSIDSVSCYHLLSRCKAFTWNYALLFVYIFERHVSVVNGIKLLESFTFLLSTMSDGNKEVDEQFEQLRVGKLIVGATRLFVYMV